MNNDDPETAPSETDSFPVPDQRDPSGDHRRAGTLAVLVGILGSIQLIGITADIAQLVNLSGGQVFLTTGAVFAAFSLVALITKEYTVARWRLIVAALTFVVSGTAVGLGITGLGIARDGARRPAGCQ